MKRLIAISLLSAPAFANVQTTTEQAFVKAKPAMVATLKQRIQQHDMYLACEKRSHATPPAPVDPRCPATHTQLIAELQSNRDRMVIQMECANEAKSQADFGACIQKKNVQTKKVEPAATK